MTDPSPEAEATLHASPNLCCNGDGRPVREPSRVLCKECFEVLDTKMKALAERLKALTGPQ